MPSANTFINELGYSILSRITPYTAWKHFRQLQKNQWLSYGEIDRLRWGRLRKLLDFAYESIPFYRDLWEEHDVDPRKFTSPEDMAHLPVVDKRMLEEAWQRNGFPPDRREAFDVAHTSGTTGRRFQVPITLAVYQKKYASHLRQIYACGWRLGMKSATIHYSGHPQFKGRYNQRVEDREPFVNLRDAALRLAHRRLVLTPYHHPVTGSDEPLKEWYGQLVSYKPFMLETMDFQLPLLKDYIERHHLTRLSIPRTFVLGTYSSGLVHELQRFFSTEIYDRYSPHEVEGVAFACNVHKGMHMAVDSYHIEFLDDRDMPVGPGESGHIIVSDMENYLMPFIRYRIGDVGHYYEEPCTCGRGLPLMGEIDGRARDRFFLKNGATLPPSRIAAVLQDEPGIVLFQAIQDEDGGVTLNIVPKGGLYSPATGERITARLRELIGEVGPISIKPVNSLTLEENGKIQFCKRMGREG